jgi:hypothetical protein
MRQFFYYYWIWKPDYLRATSLVLYFGQPHIMQHYWYLSHWMENVVTWYLTVALELPCSHLPLLFCAFARFAALYLAGLNLMLPQQTIGKERLLNVSGFITRAYLLSLSWSLPYMYLNEILASNCVCVCHGGKLRLVTEISINWDNISKTAGSLCMGGSWCITGFYLKGFMHLQDYDLHDVQIV